jgi:uncharacterized protein (TIGR02145 family)
MSCILKLFCLYSLCLSCLYASCQKYETLRDKRDNKVYKTIQISKMIWMADNLNFDIAGSRCYYDRPDNCAKYGRLYTWKAAIKACPDGWHLPTDKDWQALSDIYGNEKVAGGKLKDAGTKYWKEPNAGAKEVSGFNALPAGFCDGDRVFCYLIGEYGYYWTATEKDSANAWIRDFNYFKPDIKKYFYSKRTVFSVRCIKNNE